MPETSNTNPSSSQPKLKSSTGGDQPWFNLRPRSSRAVAAIYLRSGRDCQPAQINEMAVHMLAEIESIGSSEPNHEYKTGEVRPPTFPLGRLTRQRSEVAPNTGLVQQIPSIPVFVDIVDGLTDPLGRDGWRALIRHCKETGGRPGAGIVWIPSWDRLSRGDDLDPDVATSIVQSGWDIRFLMQPTISWRQRGSRFLPRFAS